MTYAAQTVATIIPSLRYRDASAAIEWLCSAFGFEKRAVYPDEHDAQAKAAGTTIVVDEIRDQDYGGRSYSCRDLEGHLWWFGTYDPWKDQ